MHRRQETQRSRLVGFRVTDEEHDLLRRHAAADERSITGLLRKLLADRFTGFGTVTGSIRKDKTI